MLWLWLELKKDNGIDYGTMELAVDYDRDYELWYEQKARLY